MRLLIVESKQDPGQRYWLLTNALQLSAQEVAKAYRQRWDMEVFFRFLKQELHLSHLVSLNQNGIQVMLYMTLIVAMLLLIYKHANAIGYKTAKRRFAMEVRNLAIAIIVAACGGTWTNSSKHKKVVGISSDHSCATPTFFIFNGD